MTSPVSSLIAESVMNPPNDSTNWPTLASLPLAKELNGCMWINPSPCVWIPFGSLSIINFDLQPPLYSRDSSVDSDSAQL